MSAAPPLLRVRGLSVDYGATRVVHDVDLDVPAGPFGVGLIGESGSGKTTIARALLRLHPASAGSIELEGRDVRSLHGAARKAYRRAVQIVFQDGDAALDPRMRAGASIAEALRTHRVVARADVRGRVAALLDEVGLDAEHADRYPHELSGGQRQRVVIARALAVEPRLLVLDEPTSALDVTVQARVLDLIARLRDERQLAYVLISHNLAIVDRLCEESIVLYGGRVVEHGPTRLLLQRPAHPYTQALRRAVPEIGVPLSRPATPRAPAAPTDGCPYVPRCPLAIERCQVERPPLEPVEGGGAAACHRVGEALARWDGAPAHGPAVSAGEPRRPPPGRS